jgi:hypothetical protein
MRVKLSEEKNTITMTLDQLMLEEYIGIISKDREYKLMLVPYPLEGYAFFNFVIGYSSACQKKDNIFKFTEPSEIHIFKTQEELYKWMSEIL